MAENITRCPKCQTSFRISDAHLSSAKGSVRCGSCLNIFNAKAYLVSPKPITAEPKVVTQNDVAESPEDTDSDDFLISDDMDAKPKQNARGSLMDEDDFTNEFDEELFGDSNTGEYEFNLFEREEIKDEDEDEVNEDESWALDLLEEEEKEPPPTSPTEEEIALQEEKNITEEFEASYYTNSFQIIDDEHIEEAEQQEHRQTQKTIAEDIFEDFEQDDYNGQRIEEPFESELQSQSKDYLAAIEPEPVEFDWHGRGDFWQSRLLWGALSAAAALLLFIQIAWIRFDSLSMIQPYRTYYTRACVVFSCTLPDLIDRSKIKTANLVVRSHPRVNNALMVDAVIQNMARFEQTFPTLDLVFTDRQDQLVAARRLKPRDYLAGELAGKTHMPIKQPVHIAIEIADPGQQATGYKISIAD